MGAFAPNANRQTTSESSKMVTRNRLNGKKEAPSQNESTNQETKDDSSADSKNKYKFRETDSRLKKIKHQQKISNESGNSKNNVTSLPKSTKCLNKLNKTTGQIRKRANNINSADSKQSLIDLTTIDTTISKKLKRKTISIESDLSNFSDMINSNKKKKLNIEKLTSPRKSRKSTQANNSIRQQAQNKPKDVFEFTDENDDTVYTDSNVLKNPKNEDIFNKFKISSNLTSPATSRLKNRLSHSAIKPRKVTTKRTLTTAATSFANFKENSNKYKPALGASKLAKSLVADRSNSHGGDTASDASSHGSSTMNQCGSSNSCSDDDASINRNLNLNEDSSSGDNATDRNGELDNDNDDTKSNENSNSTSTTNNNDDLVYRNEASQLIDGSFDQVKNRAYFVSQIRI
jgi:hypothetical protein